VSDGGPLYLLDGSSLVFRAFFALPEDLATSTGTVTNAVHGFVGMITSVLREHRPEAMAVAFDLPTPTFRDAVVADYKGNRPDTPELLGPQFDLVHAVLDALGIARVVVDGYEADDVLATLATRGRDAKRPVVVVSGDRDTFQLVEDPYVAVLYTRRGLSDTVRYDEAAIIDRYGVPPSRYPLLAALRGDPSDNLPGVPGVGEKTAARLAATYGSVDELYAHLDELTPKLRQNLAAHEADVRRNAQVIPLVRDVPLPVGLDDLRLGRWDVEATRRLFAELELRGAWQRLAPLLVGDGTPSTGAARPARAARPDGASSELADDGASSGRAVDGASSHPAGRWTVGDVAVPGDRAAAVAELTALGGSRGPDTTLLAVARWHGDPGRSPLAGLGLAVADGLLGPPSLAATATTSTGLWLTGSLLEEPEVVAALARLVGDEGMAVAGHGLKELMRSLLPLGVDVCRVALDTEVAAGLLDATSATRTLADVAARWLGSPAELAGSGPPSLTGWDEAMASAQPDGAAAGSDAAGASPAGAQAAGTLATLGAVVERLAAQLADEGLVRLHDEVERPLVRVLARMEVAGIAVDAAELRRIAEAMAAECRRLQDEVQALAGVTFNVNSTAQLREVLFGTLGLTPVRRTKTGFSTDAQTLERLRHEHPVVDALLRYREVEKLRSTYGTSLLAEVAPDGRIHATFHQIGARTGRLSSDRPNLHNIPVRTEEGMALRRAFVAAPGQMLVVADYDQIELRVIAHLSGDPGLRAAFADGRDVHRATAARVFGVPEEAVSPEQRSRAKMVSYGLAYGMEAWGLAQRLGIGTDEASEILRAYFRAFPAVEAYMAQVVAEARRRGYTETALGRRRALPDLTSSNRGLRQAAERQAMNAAVQGLAADLFKLALVRLDAELPGGPLAVGGGRLVLQVHDEVVVECPEDAVDEVEALVATIMVGVADVVGLSVPLQVGTGHGRSWADAKR